MDEDKNKEIRTLGNVFLHFSCLFRLSMNKEGGKRKGRRRLRAVDYARQKKAQTAKLKESQNVGRAP
jgi:hypothetical protein